MKLYRIVWKDVLSETELEILLQEWKGYFEVVGEVE
tara:strand:+ start:648 stop:755 length:108 start_codon:yes stop_codon:yes gene_type:complete